MVHGMVRWRLAAVGLAAAMATSLVACSGGVSQADYDAVKKQLQDEQQKAQTFQSQLSTKVQETTALQQQVAAKEKAAADLQKQLSDAQKAGGLPAGTTLILAAKQVPPPAPRPTPTPPPPGFTPPPPPPVPGTFLAPLQLYIHADTVTAGPGESKLLIDAAANVPASCVATSIFKRGMHVVWRFEIVDAVSGKRLTDKEIDSAVVHVPGIDDLKGRFGRHGATDTAPWFWTAAWDVPADYPLGVLDWTIDAKAKDGKTGNFKLWMVSIPERGIEARTQIIE